MLKTARHTECFLLFSGVEAFRVLHLPGLVEKQVVPRTERGWLVELRMGPEQLWFCSEHGPRVAADTSELSNKVRQPGTVQCLGTSWHCPPPPR